MADLFKEIVPSILVTKKDILEDENDYDAFIVNKALSYHMDCVLYANELNMLPNLDAKLQYHYFLHSIRAYKRKFVPWIKKEKSENINLLAEYYGFSKAKAREVVSMFSDVEMAKIKAYLDKGGATKR
jgi:hypothetical protein